MALVLVWDLGGGKFTTSHGVWPNLLRLTGAAALLHGVFSRKKD